MHAQYTTAVLIIMYTHVRTCTVLIRKPISTHINDFHRVRFNLEGRFAVSLQADNIMINLKIDVKELTGTH